MLIQRYILKSYSPFNITNADIFVQDAYTIYKYIHCLVHKKQVNLALTYFEKLIAMDGRTRYKEEFANFLAEHKGDYERAEDMWRQAVDAAVPEDKDEVYHNIAVFYIKYSITLNENSE
jgi:tetratricopeptide (TPR) repeat protein